MLDIAATQKKPPNAPRMVEYIFLVIEMSATVSAGIPIFEDVM